MLSGDPPKSSGTFGYDAANRLTSANTGANAATYDYNGEGVRVGKTVNGTTTAYLQDVVGDLPHVLTETAVRSQSVKRAVASSMFPLRVATASNC